jgi:hypothetical protein
MKYLQDYREEKQSTLFNETGAFFAFSEEQLIKGLNGRDKSEVVNLGGGLIANKTQVKQIYEGLDRIENEAMEEDLKENGAEGIISREFFNHETSYDGDESRVLDALKPYRDKFPTEFEVKKIASVFKECYKVEIE